MVDIKIGEKHDDVGKGGEMGDAVCEVLSLTVRGQHRRIHLLLTIVLRMGS